jgi:sporulation protein YhbH
MRGRPSHHEPGDAMERIDSDRSRFNDIVRGRIRKNLKKFISQGELIGKQGKDLVSVPVPQVDLPRFKFGQRENGGLGQGDGEPGDPVQGGDGQQGGQGKQAGDSPGEHALEVELTLDELAQILGQELELPRIEPKGKKKFESWDRKYTGIRPVGPNSLRNFKRTFQQALKRQIVSGTYDPKNPIIVPIREDMRFRSFREEVRPHHNAVIIYMMDVSGSMGDEQKEIVRIESFWIDTWLRSQYKGIESRYIIHDASAREVDRDTFFRTRESGGTMISSAYRKCLEIMEKDYPSGEWNIYPFHFSDGDNWSADDTNQCVKLIRESIIPNVNVFCYGQVESPYGSGQFIKDLKVHFKDHESVITSEIKNKDAIVRSIKDFLGKGK